MPPRGACKLRTMSPRVVVPLGVAGTTLIALGSFGAGATRNRGGMLDYFGWAFLSYGHARGLADVALTAGLFLLVFAWVMLQGAHVEQVRAAVWGWTAPLLLAAPLMSRDVYSYLMQGAMVRDGFNPYDEGAAVNPGPYLLEVSHDWRNTTTPYGPLHLWIGEGVTTAVGDNVMAGIIVYKFISFAGFAAIAWAVPRIARELGGDPALALWLGVANPVMIIHMVGGMHNESVMVGLVSIGLLACLHSRFFVGIVLISVAVSLKATAAIALPFVVWIAMQRYGRRVTVFLATGVSVVALSIAVVAAVTWASGTSWGWLAEISGNSKVVNPLSGATLITDLVTPLVWLVDEEFPYNTVLDFTRTIGSLLMLVGLVVVWVLYRQSQRRAVKGVALAYLVAFVFNAVTLPWYYASSISVAGTFAPPRWLVKVTVAASVIVALSFMGSGNHRFYVGWWMLAVFLLGWLAARSVKTPLPARA